MSAQVIPFRSNAFLSEEVDLSSNSKIRLLRKQTLENYLSEIELIQFLREGFVDGLEMFESDLIEGDIDGNEEIFRHDDRLELLSIIGTFSQKYGTFNVNFTCTGKGHIEFSYCFDSPNISNCCSCFPKTYLEATFGKNFTELKLFENYLRGFMITGEISRSSTSSKGIAELRTLTNPQYPLSSQSCPIKFVNKILALSGQSYFAKYGVHIPNQLRYATI